MILFFPPFLCSCHSFYPYYPYCLLFPLHNTTVPFSAFFPSLSYFSSALLFPLSYSSSILSLPSLCSIFLLLPSSQLFPFPPLLLTLIFFLFTSLSSPIYPLTLYLSSFCLFPLVIFLTLSKSIFLSPPMSLVHHFYFY